jgi:hypothetical protein
MYCSLGTIIGFIVLIFFLLSYKENEIGGTHDRYKKLFGKPEGRPWRRWKNIKTDINPLTF